MAFFSRNIGSKLLDSQKANKTSFGGAARPKTSYASLWDKKFTGFATPPQMGQPASSNTFGAKIAQGMSMPTGAYSPGSEPESQGISAMLAAKPSRGRYAGDFATPVVPTDPSVPFDILTPTNPDGTITLTENLSTTLSQPGATAIPKQEYIDRLASRGIFPGTTVQPVATQPGPAKVPEKVLPPTAGELNISDPQEYYDYLISHGFSSEQAQAYSTDPNFRGAAQPAGAFPTGTTVQPAVEEPQPELAFPKFSEEFNQYVEQLQAASDMELDKALNESAEMYNSYKNRILQTGGRGYGAAYGAQITEADKAQIADMAATIRDNQIQVTNQIASAMWDDMINQREQERWEAEFGIQRASAIAAGIMDENGDPVLYSIDPETHQLVVDPNGEPLSVALSNVGTGITYEQLGLDRAALQASGMIDENGNVVRYTQDADGNFVPVYAGQAGYEDALPMDMLVASASNRQTQVQINHQRYQDFMDDLMVISPELAGQVIGQQYLNWIDSGQIWGTPEKQEAARDALPQVVALTYAGNWTGDEDTLKANLDIILSAYDMPDAERQSIIGNVVAQWSDAQKRKTTADVSLDNNIQLKGHLGETGVTANYEKLSNEDKAKVISWHKAWQTSDDRIDGKNDGEDFLDWLDTADPALASLLRYGKALNNDRPYWIGRR